MTNKQYTVDVQEDSNGEQYIVLPDEIILEFDWKEGDVIEWIADSDNMSYTLRKKE